MSRARLEAVATETKQDISMQPASVDIWDKKYRLKTKRGVAIDADIDGTYQRVAKALAEAEPTVELQQYWQERFTWALRRGAIPAGRITSNAGAQEHKPATSTINCTVSGTITDSMDGILEKVHEAGLTLKAGCGIGYEFSTLRPRGAFVAGAGAYTSGPMSFMDIFDKMCFTVSSAGGRRGAQMGTFDVSHPDVKDFIRAKREDGRLRQFNLSLLITDGFMQAVESDDDWPLVFPINAKERGEIDLDDATQVVWRDWPLHANYIVRDGQTTPWHTATGTSSTGGLQVSGAGGQAGVTWNLNGCTEASYTCTIYARVVGGALGSGTSNATAVSGLYTLQLQNTVPVPAAVWLMGGALGGLGMIRRRQKAAA